MADGGPGAAAGGIRVIWRESPSAVKALLVGVFVNKLAGFIQVFLVLFLTDRGFTSGQAGLALGVYAAGAVLGTFLGGSLTDRLSARNATLTSMVGSAGLIVAILYLPTYPLLVVAVFLVSTVGQLYRPASQTLITELTPRHRLVMVTAMYRLALNLGTTAAPLLGAALLSVSYGLLFWGEALAALAYAVIAVVALPRRTGHPESAAHGDGPALRSPRAGGYWAVVADWRFSVFLGAILLIAGVYAQYTASLPLAIAGAGLSLWWYGAIVSLNGVIVVTCELLMTKVVQRWPLRLTVLIGLGLVAVGYGIYAIGMHPSALIVGTVVWTVAEIVGAPTLFAFPGMVAPERLQGRYIGAMQTAFGLGSTIGPVAGILLWNRIGQAVWLWAAGVAAVATVLGQIGIRMPATRLSPATVPADAAAQAAPDAMAPPRDQPDDRPILPSVEPARPA